MVQVSSLPSVRLSSASNGESSGKPMRLVNHPLSPGGGPSAMTRAPEGTPLELQVRQGHLSAALAVTSIHQKRVSHPEGSRSPHVFVSVGGHVLFMFPFHHLLILVSYTHSDNVEEVRPCESKWRGCSAQARQNRFCE